MGDIIDGIVSDFGSDGEGVIKLDGYPVFVPYAIKGEEVRARITYAKKDCAFGEVVEVVTPSPSRVKPRCPYFGKCGGCDLQHADTPLQLEIKRNSVENALKKFAGLNPNESMIECGSSSNGSKTPKPLRLNDFEYRNKLSLPFAYNSHTGRVSLGFYEKRSHKVVPMKWCPLHGEWAANLIAVLTEWANEFNISVYDENTHKGLLRHAVARMLDTLSLTLVINGDR
ncbi:MAG: TRAM domain-containing protein, partial [Clostridia bacterium]|nr:TRAM domain-containing protein [Clostridia bacterium]